MQVELSLVFPHALKEVPVSFLIPLPAQRPRTVANLFFMCTGQLPLPSELLSALHLTGAEVAYQTLDDAKKAGLLPLSDSAVIRIDKASIMEIGSSTTKSIFGDFIPDEPVTLPADTAVRGQSIAATMSSLKAGTLLYANLGMPHSQASRYYILLEHVITPEQREELRGFAPLGMVTSGLTELRKAVAQTAVQPRTLVPKKRIIVSGCRMMFDYAQLASSAAAHASSASPFEGPGEGAGQSAGQRRVLEPHERVAGRVRRREEESDENEQADPRNALDKDGDAASPGTAPSQSTGFFKVSARFPKAVAAAVAASGGGPSLKRRRAEAFVMGSDGLPTLRTTAIAPNEQVDSNGAAVPFEFFRAQQDAFTNDVDDIRDAQRQQLNRKARKNRAQEASVSRRKGRQHSSSQQPLRSDGKRATGISAASNTRGKKKMTKRY